MALVISNTSPIIALARVNALRLILKVFDTDKFYITQEVFNELKDKNTREKVSTLISQGKLGIMPKATNISELNSIAYEISIRNPKPDPKTWVLSQHIGEASVILKGREHKADFLLMDDWGGRQVANEKGFKRIRHFAVICKAVENSILSKSDALKYLSILEKEYKYENAEHYRRLWSNE